jgi:DNA-directed RNA polymerase specialized sigma24 family protein
MTTTKKTARKPATQIVEVLYPNEFFTTVEEYREFMQQQAILPTQAKEDTMKNELIRELAEWQSEYGNFTPATVATKEKASAKESVGYGETEFTKAQMAKRQTTYKSVVIRALHEEGMKPSEIAKRMGIRPQHVHNTINQVYKG